MAKLQSRRSISVAGETYLALRRHCDEIGRSMSDVVEELLAGAIGSTRPRRRRAHRTATATEGEPLKVTPPRRPPPAFAIPEGRNGNGRPAPAPATTCARIGGPRCF